ncbi:hypothetical protein [Enterococcus sp.]|uniref:RCC1 domain-containing protein n=1 Tax=Enterococcus sp. TaxID=35783 RepID=UPI00290BA4CD|nr:hypothetical protein [Enterococcus sp.]MDU5333436.1 hypothetical protein [Enterococcus sp.]
MNKRVIKFLLAVLLLSIGSNTGVCAKTTASIEKSSMDSTVATTSKEEVSTTTTSKIKESSSSSEEKVEKSQPIKESEEQSSESKDKKEETSDSKFVQLSLAAGSLQRSLPTLESSFVPDPVPQLSAVKFIDTVTIYRGGMALDNQGAVWMWGYNSHGVQGIDMPEKVKDRDRYQGGMKRVPYFINSNIKIKKIWGSYSTAYALGDNGKLYAWGRGYDGQMGNGTSLVAGSDNLLPKEVDFPSNEEILELYPGSEAAHCIYATTKTGNVYAWGYRDGGRIPFISSGTYVTRPAKIQELTDLQNDETIISMSMGDNHGIIATAAGKVYTFGGNGYGQRGTGSTGGTQQLAETNFFTTRNLIPVEVSADLNNSFVLTDEGDIYQFGRLYHESTAGSNYTTPVKVEIDASSSAYTPFFVSVDGGKYATHALDQYGRVWVWGNNRYYQFGTDGPLYGSRPTTVAYDYKTPSNGKLDTYLKLATQLPQTLGDGDTQYNHTVPKGPVFSNVTYNGRVGFQLTGYQNQGMWSDIDDAAEKKHPTIYDKKYYKTVGVKGTVSNHAPSLSTLRNAHNKVYMVDDKERRLVYVVRKDGTSTISGNFYVAKDEYDGSWFVDNRSTTSLPNNVTEETSVPDVKEDERNWIELSTGGEANDFTGTQNAQFPGITEIASYQSAMQFLDASGNLYKTGLDGSGSIAWGWDYDPVYDWYGGTGRYGADNTYTSSHATDGLFDSYCYEVMFMRGAPRVISGNIDISAPREKHYKSQEAKEKVKIEIGLGSAYHSAQLNLTIEPELREAKYLIIPYDTDDPNMEISSPSEEEFNSAYNQASSLGYTAHDLADKNGWTGTKQELGQPEIKLEDESIEVSDNCVVWVLVKTNYYGAEPAVVSRKVFDNYYTETDIKHNGVEHSDTNNVLYKATNKNVSKVTNDGIEKLVGFPLDKNGKIIGTTTKPPTFGYDETKVAKLTDAQWDELFESDEVKDDQVAKHRAAILAKTKNDFVASGNTWSQDIEDKVTAWIDSWIEEWIEEEWLPQYKNAWKFYTPQTSEKTYTLNGVEDATNNDDLSANKGELAVSDKYVHSFHYEKDEEAFAKVHYLGVDDEGEKLDPFSMGTEEILKKVTYKRLVPELLIDDVDYLPIEYKTTNGKPATVFPINVDNATEIGENNEVTFKAGATVDEMTVNVIYKAYTSILLHVRQVIQNPNSAVKRPSNGFMSLNNVKLPSYDQKFSTKNIVTNSGDINKTVAFNEYVVPLQKGYKGIKVDWLTPQYYKYLGFVLTEEENEQNISKLNSTRNIHLDCDGKDVYWLTVYLEPDTTINDYAWDQKTNHFGEINTQ